jgi:hypothetical protein
MVEDAVDGSVALGAGVGGVGQPGGVGAQQVVQRISAGGVLVEQIGPHQFGQQRANLIDGEGGEAGRRGGGDVGAGVQTEKPE